MTSEEPCPAAEKQYTKVRQPFLQVMEENPQHAKAYYRRGLAYTVTGDYEEARADFNKVRQAWAVMHHLHRQV